MLAAVVAVAFAGGFMIRGGGAAGGQATAVEAGHDHGDEPSLWTCSMHPQIQLPKQGKCPICFMDLIPVESGSSDDAGPRELTMSESARLLAGIETTPVRRRTTSREVRMSGRLSYDETRLAAITARVPGRLDSLYVNFTGMTVRQGQPLAAIYSPELLSAQRELLEAKKAEQSLTDSRSKLLRETAAATIAAARGKLRLLGFDAEQIDAIEISGEVKDHLTINSPIGGVVVQVHIRQGEYVKTGSKLHTIVDLSRLWVLFDAYESDLPWLQLNQKVAFQTQLLAGKIFTGTVTFIDPILDTKTRTAAVRVSVDNQGGRLKPDMFVSGTVSTSDVSDAEDQLVIPVTAPLVTGKRAVVYVQLTDHEEPTFEGRVIELGPRVGEFYVVKSGLDEGEMVVTNGAFKIDSELQIRAKPSMMNPGGGAVAVHRHGEASMPSTDHQMEEMEPEQMTNIGTEAVASLTAIYDTYFKLQMALADDDLDAARDAGIVLADAVGGVDMSLFKGEGHEKWMKISKVLSESAVKGGQAEDIIGVRDAFYYISEAVIDLETSFGHAADQDYFLTFCPMAREHKGAFWLQTVDTVYNSFYGASMLRCGAIKDTLPAIADGKGN